jgi:uncharacterized protein
MMGSNSLQYLLCMAPAILLMMFASWYVKAAYAKWGKVANQTGTTGAQAAQRLIQVGGLQGIQLEGVAGTLTDHYDPKANVLRLSQGVAQVPSIAAVAVAAHELGHALQDKENYFPMKVRSAIVPLVSIGSNLGWILLMIGFALYSANIALGIDLAWLGVIFFAGGAFFALVTLPVELNASKRARQLLQNSGIITTSEEMRGVSNVLNAAALTYVGSLVSAIAQLLYYASMVVGMGRRRN